MVIPKSLRFEILTRDGYACQYCGAKAPDAVLHVDHVNPRANGGDNSPSNLVTACADCNFGKGDRKLLGNGHLSKEERPARMRRALEARRTQKHHLTHIGDWDPGSPSEDETDSFLAMVWCETCKKHEMRWVPRTAIDYGFDPFDTDKPPSPGGWGRMR